MNDNKPCTIVVSVINDLVTDQRVHKVCTSLQAAGYEVLLIGRRFRSSKPLRRDYRIHRMRLLFNKSFLFYLEYNLRLCFYLLFVKADVFLSNDTDTLIANYLASAVRRKPLVFDAHEMMPDTPEVPSRHFVRSFWKGIEDRIFPKLKYCYTVCESIAEIYNKRYNIRMQVVRNIPFGENADTPLPKEKTITAGGKKIILYQGAVNRGRGIEWMIDAMPLLEEWIFIVIGDGDVMPAIREQVRRLALEDRVQLLGRVPFEALSAYTSQADIGPSLLENRGLSYYYSLPNRIFDFIRRNIPILATDFPEIRKIIESYQVGTLIDHYEPSYLAAVIREMATEGKQWPGFVEANRELTWEHESEVLLKIMEKATTV